MNEIARFHAEVEQNVAGLQADLDVQALSRIWVREIARHKYAYNFSWMGRPLIQFPQDMAAIQELVWKIRPDLIIETGIAHGGSLIMSASLLAMLDYCDAVEDNRQLDPRAPSRRVLGIDIEIRDHNRRAVEAHPMAGRIDMIEDSSTDPAVVARVYEIAKDYQRVLVLLDSNHTQDHVLGELRAYSPLVSPGSYCVVFDTLIEQLPDFLNRDRPWRVGNNPMTAVEAFLSCLDTEHVMAADGGRLRLSRDTSIDSKLLISAAPRGYLRRLDPTTEPAASA